MKQKGLGRGLDAIFGNDHLDAKLKPMTEMAEIAVSEIIPNPTQPQSIMAINISIIFFIIFISFVKLLLL